MAGLFDRGYDIAGVVAAERSRLPAQVAPPFMPRKRPPVFDIEGAHTPGSFPAQRFGSGPQVPATGATGANVAAGAPVAMTAPTMAAPPQSLMSGALNALSTANTLSKLPGYAETLAPLWEAPTPGIGLNTILSGQGPGSVAGGIDSAVNAGLGGGGLFGAAVPAAAVPGGATAATIGGIGNSAATVAFNPSWAAGPAAGIAAPIALPFVLSGLFGDDSVLTPEQQFDMWRGGFEDAISRDDRDELLAWESNRMTPYAQLGADIMDPNNEFSQFYGRLQPSTQEYLQNNRSLFTDELARRQQVQANNPLLYGGMVGGP